MQFLTASHRWRFFASLFLLSLNRITLLRSTASWLYMNFTSTSTNTTIRWVTKNYANMMLALHSMLSGERFTSWELTGISCNHYLKSWLCAYVWTVRSVAHVIDWKTDWIPWNIWMSDLWSPVVSYKTALNTPQKQYLLFVVLVIIWIPYPIRQYEVGRV